MSASELQRELMRVTVAVQAVDVRAFEEREDPAALKQLATTISELAAAGIDALTAVLRHYESHPGEDGPSCDQATADRSAGDERYFYEDLEALMSTASGASRIADVAFMARWELARKRESLSRVESEEDPWKIIAECGSARRRLMKSATAVELAIAEHEGIESTLKAAYVTEMHRSLETRRVYALFRRHVRNAGPFEESNARTCLRASGTAIATIVGRNVYEDLRVTDRIQLRKLQRRILGWLAGDDGFDVESARRIWQDLAACADLLLQVNHRAELVNHDRDLIAAILASLAEAQRSSPPPDEAVERARLLRGRDAELDELLERSPRAPVAEWLALLQRIQRALRQEESDDRGSGPLARPPNSLQSEAVRT